MDHFEEEVDNINWQEISKEIDRALINNLAAEIGFPSYAKLEQASELVVDDYYICHRSDGKWVWWNPTTYVKEDPKFFDNKEEAMEYIVKFLQLDEKGKQQLKSGFDQVQQTRKCLYCEHELNPLDPSRAEWDRENELQDFCSPECAMDSLMEEMKEGKG